MFPQILICSFIGTLLLIKPTLQVDIEFSIFDHSYAIGIAQCRNIQPGVCCRPPPARPPPEPRGLYHQVTVKDLGPSDIASLWATDRWPDGCHGRSWATAAGPTAYWHEYVPDPHYIAGASYIRLELAPPETQAESDWLSAQGIRALAWNGGHSWTSGSTIIRAFYPRSLISRISKRSEIQRRSRRRWVQHGTAYITEPPREQYVDLIAVNGTDYTDEGHGVYRDESGRALDLSSIQG